MSLFLSFAPLLVVFLLIPLVMLLVGKLLKIKSEKLKYSRLLLITFVGSILGSFVMSLHPYALYVVFVGTVTYMIKSQLNASWGKALVMTLGGILVGGLLNYGITFLGIGFFG